jgi:type II secretory pathway component PulF
MSVDSNMRIPELDPSSLAKLLDEVSAMTAARRSLVSGLTDFGDLSLGKIGRAAKFICSRLNQGCTVADSIVPLSGRYGSTVRTTFDLVSRTGTTKAIDQIVQMIREEEQAKRDLRIAIIQPLISVLVAAAILFWVIPQLLIVDASGQRMKDGLEHPIKPILENYQSEFWWWIIVSVIGFILLGFLVGWAIRRMRHRVVGLKHQATFCRWMALMVGSNTDLATSIEAASSVVGSKGAAAWSVSANQVRGGAQSIESLKIPENVSEKVGQCLADLASHRRGVDEVAKDLDALSELYQHQSMFRQRFRIEIIPKIISMVVAVVTISVVVKTAIKPLLDAVEQVAR